MSDRFEIGFAARRKEAITIPGAFFKMRDVPGFCSAGHIYPELDRCFCFDERPNKCKVSETKLSAGWSYGGAMEPEVWDKHRNKYLYMQD